MREAQVIVIACHPRNGTAWGISLARSAAPASYRPTMDENGDEILRRVFDDHCTLRRYLVDEQFMSRTAAGVYWRPGGTVR